MKTKTNTALLAVSSARCCESRRTVTAGMRASHPCAVQMQVGRYNSATETRRIGPMGASRCRRALSRRVRTAERPSSGVIVAPHMAACKGGLVDSVSPDPYTGRVRISVLIRTSFRRTNSHRASRPARTTKADANRQLNSMLGPGRGGPQAGHRRQHLASG